MLIKTQKPSVVKRKQWTLASSFHPGARGLKRIFRPRRHNHSAQKELQHNAIYRTVIHRPGLPHILNETEDTRRAERACQLLFSFYSIRRTQVSESNEPHSRFHGDRITEHNVPVTTSVATQCMQKSLTLLPTSTGEHTSRAHNLLSSSSPRFYCAHVTFG